jgi:AbiV family abortive infection protein
MIRRSSHDDAAEDQVDPEVRLSTSVTPQYLLHGAVYALEQCGLLLRDANLLYESGSYATAVALASFAREEQGRWRILLDLRKEVLGGKAVTVEDIRGACEGHVQKQQAGMLSLTMRADRDTGLGKLLQARAAAAAAPASKEWKEKEDQLQQIDRLKKKRIPDDRHKQRMSALYVDPKSVDQWNRPREEISQTEAHDFLVDAGNDYGLQRSQRYMELAILKESDPELHDALVQWADRPELPEVTNPSFPAD